MKDPDRQFLRVLHAAIVAWQSRQLPDEPSRVVAPVLVAVERALQHKHICPCCGQREKTDEKLDDWNFDLRDGI